MTNNELSRKVLEQLRSHQGRLKFRALVEMVGADARAVFKNLFFLEERGYVQLSTSYPPEAVYPQIHLVRLRPAGEELVKDPPRLDAVFPLSDSTTDTRLHIPPDLKEHELTYAQVLEMLALRIRESMSGTERDALLEKIESLLALPLSREPVWKP